MHSSIFLPLQATVGAIVAGGAADLDGRLQVGDEILTINQRSVLDASHREVISLMGEAAAQGEVVLTIQRKMPMPESVPPLQGGGGQMEDSLPSVPQGIRDVVIERPNTQTSFGFVLQSNTLRPGCMICESITLVHPASWSQAFQISCYLVLIVVSACASSNGCFVNVCMAKLKAD